MTEKDNPVNGKEDRYSIKCDEVLDISTAAELKSSLAQALQGNKSIDLLAADVERADTAALQILIAFFKEASVQGIEAQWVDASKGLCQSAQLLGLEDVLNLKDIAA